MGNGPAKSAWSRFDEENLLLEIREDRRLVRLGINPDGDPAYILLKLWKRIDKPLLPPVAWEQVWGWRLHESFWPSLVIAIDPAGITSGAK
jgi:hypothetical protein